MLVASERLSGSLLLVGHPVYRGKAKQFICGGTLISQKLILTAAHCVTNKTGHLQYKRQYTVAVGNYYGEYNNSLNKETQISELEDIFIPPEHRSIENNFEGDIALLVAKKTFIFSEKVEPVCVDWTLTYSDNVKTSGYISDWEFTTPNASLGITSQDLKIPIKQCLETTSTEFQVYITKNTLCGDTPLCGNDAGGALVTAHDGRFYITGIISTIPSISEGNCKKNHYTMYTNISAYNNFLIEKDLLIKSLLPKQTECGNGDSCQTTAKPPVVPIGKKSSCILPQHPASGRWFAYGARPGSLFPGMIVRSNTVLEIKCDENHKLEGGNFVFCDKGKWSSNIGFCLRTCPPIESTETMKVTCIYKNKETENCTDAVDGTLAKFKCALFFEDLALKRAPVHICQNGSWNRPAPNCVPVCGQKTVDATQLIVGGSPVSEADYPWQVALYNKSGNHLICGGSLLTQRIILTAAHCITDKKGKLALKENYIVAVRKFYSSFNDTRDFNTAQFSELSDMFVPQQYNGEIQNYYGDIAILVTQKNFTLSPRVLPVCLDFAQVFKPSVGDRGFISSWGYTSENSTLSALKELAIPFISRSQCEIDIPEDYRYYLTYDKLCAGHFSKDTSVCRGDSGSGLVFKHDGRYYIEGILSLTPTSPTNANDCDHQQYSLYTNVSIYINNFILPKLGEFQT